MMMPFHGTHYAFSAYGAFGHERLGKLIGQELIGHQNIATAHCQQARAVSALCAVFPSLATLHAWLWSMEPIVQACAWLLSFFCCHFC